MNLTVDDILKNTSDDELFVLFGMFLQRAIPKFQYEFDPVDEGYKDPVLLDKERGLIIKEMRNA